MKKILNKKAQMEIPFQLIFSLILIAAFIYAAATGIKYFLATAELAKANLFITQLDSDVENIWLTTSEVVPGRTFEYALPSRIKYVCFNQPNNLSLASLNTLQSRDKITACSDFERYIKAFNDTTKNFNMFFCPADSAWKIKAPIYASINCKSKNCLEFKKSPYCVQNIGGTVKITLTKEYGAGKIQLT